MGPGDRDFGFCAYVPLGRKHEQVMDGIEIRRAGPYLAGIERKARDLGYKLMKAEDLPQPEGAG